MIYQNDFKDFLHRKDEVFDNTVNAVSSTAVHEVAVRSL